MVSVEVATRVLLARQGAEFAAMQSRIEHAQEVAGRILAEHSQLGAEPGIEGERIFGTAEIRDRIAELGRGAMFELAAFDPGRAHRPEALEASRERNLEALDRGVRSRTIHLSSIRDDEAALAQVRSLTKQGAEMKTAPTLPVRMIISDRTRAILAVGGRRVLTP